jgi:hypothetical protein
VNDDAGRPVSGLRNPVAAVRGAGAGALATMALVLLLAIVPLIKLKAPGGAVALAATLAGVAIGLAGMLRRTWAWWAGLVVPVALLAAWGWSVPLGVLGVLFLLLWGYLLHVRRVVLGGSRDGSPSGAAPSG